MAGSILYSYPLNLNTSQSNGNGDHRITFQALLPRFGTTNPALGDVVALYLPPDALKTSYSQSYGDVELGGAGLALMGVDSGAAQDAFDALNPDGGGGVKAAMAAAERALKNAPIAAALGKAAVTEGVGAIAQKMGTASHKDIGKYTVAFL